MRRFCIKIMKRRLIFQFQLHVSAINETIREIYIIVSLYFLMMPRTGDVSRSSPINYTSNCVFFGESTDRK